ncbi:MAG: hypothetical protein L0Z54_02820 [Thermoplasmata archaeon]|nr:hypothetical protein [Thermoplasmata archaeon]
MKWYNVKYTAILGVAKRVLFMRNRGTRVMDEEWDHLIILDACRYDMFERAASAGGEAFPLEGALESRTSLGSNTEEFLLRNFPDGRRLEDIVYVTGNPFVNKLMEGRFHRIVPVWRTDWSDEHHTVLPEAVYRSAIMARRDFAGKRLIIHFMQPHFPFVSMGEIGDVGLERLRESMMGGDADFANTTIWRLLEGGEARIEDIVVGYQRNFELVLPHALRLARELGGRVIVTSDHGEALGERLHPLLPMRIYGHHKRTWMGCLVTVPWFVHQGDGIAADAMERDTIGMRVADLRKAGRI